MSNRTFQYFCNRERLLLLKEVSEEEDRETYEKMKKARQWDRNELFDMVYHACVFLDDTQAQKAYSILWYIKYRENPVMKKYGQFFVANSIFRNKHIDEIKEILTVDVDSPFAWMYIDEVYLYDLYSKKGSNEKGYCVEVDLRSFDNTIEDGLNNDEYGWMCPLYYVVYADRLSDIQVRMDYIIEIM